MKLLLTILFSVQSYQVLYTSTLRGPSPPQQEAKCQYKKGYLTQENFVTGEIMDVYVVLNKNSVSLFSNEEVDNLITSLNLQDLYPPELDTCCVQLQSGSSSHAIRLCADSFEDIQCWFDSINEFLECNSSSSSLKQAEKINDEEDQVQQIKEEEELRRKAEEIVQSVKETEQLEKDNKLKMKQEMQKANFELERVKLQKEYLEKAMEAKASEEELLAEKLIKSEKRKQELAELQQAVDKIQKQKEDEANQLLDQQKQLIDNKKRLARDELQSMVKIAVTGSDKQRADQCWQEGLKGGNDTLMRQICDKKYGEDPVLWETELNLCYQKENFCKLCCEGYIGVQYMQDRMMCQYDYCEPLLL